MNKKSIVHIPRLKEACKWLKDDEVYIVYYKNLSIRVTPALGDCFQIQLVDPESKKNVRFVLFPHEMDMFSKIINAKLSELWGYEE